MLHRKLTVAHLWVDDIELRLKYATVLAVRKPGVEEIDWECVAYSLDAHAAPFDLGAYSLRATTIEGPEVTGSAVLVRSTGASHVWRGAGPLEGLEGLESPEDLDEPNP